MLQGLSIVICLYVLARYGEMFKSLRVFGRITVFVFAVITFFIMLACASGSN